MQVAFARPRLRVDGCARRAARCCRHPDTRAPSRRKGIAANPERCAAASNKKHLDCRREDFRAQPAFAGQFWILAESGLKEFAKANLDRAKALSKYRVPMRVQHRENPPLDRACPR